MLGGAFITHWVEANCSLMGTLYALDAMLVLRIHTLVNTKRSERIRTAGKPYAMLYRRGDEEKDVFVTLNSRS